MALAGGYGLTSGRGGFGVPDVRNIYTAPLPTQPYTAGTVSNEAYRAPTGYQGTGAPSGMAPTNQAVMNAPTAFSSEDVYRAANQTGDVSTNWDWLNNWMGQTDAWGRTQTGYANENFQNQLDKLNWERGGLADQVTNANQNLGFRDEIIANLQKLYGINDAATANQIAQSILDQSVQSNILNQQTGLNALTGKRQGQELRSAGIAGGSMFFPGQEIGQAQISEETSRNADILANRLRGVVEGGDLTRAGYRIGADKERVGLDNSILGSRMSRLSDLGTAQQLNRRGGQFDIEERGLRNSLGQTLGQQNYARFTDMMEKIQGLMSTGDAANRKNAEDLMAQFMQGGY
jgi:hypothetical protein